MICLWLDNITRGLLKDGTLRRYIEELSNYRAYLKPVDLRSRH
jgi:hypothetical protein